MPPTIFFLPSSQVADEEDDEWSLRLSQKFTHAVLTFLELHIVTSIEAFPIQIESTISKINTLMSCMHDFLENYAQPRNEDN